MDSTSRHMNKSKAVELLKQLTNEIPHLRTLNYENTELMPWLDRVKNILSLAFDDDDYQKFVNAKLRSDMRLMGDEVHQSNYQYNLTTRKTILQSIIDKHEILETESERLPTKEPQDTVNLALHTFDAKRSLNIYENLGGRIVGNEFEVALLGTVDMTIECMMHFTKKLNSLGHSYKSSSRIGGHPDYAKPDRTCFATCTITETTEDTEKQIGTIELQLLPNERTLLKTSHPKDWDSSFKYFLDALFTEFEQLGYIKKEKTATVEGLPPEAPIAKANWKDIEKDFGVTKMRFGKRINFIKDPFKRTIIFRDVEQAYILASQDFPKPAVILAGSVIEELLRLYLECKNISPLSENFDGYIRTCEQHGLLKDSVSRLSHSVRQFRNLVHLSAEKTKKHTISKATAIGAVSSIFTIANDF